MHAILCRHVYMCKHVLIYVHTESEINFLTHQPRGLIAEKSKNNNLPFCVSVHVIEIISYYNEYKFKEEAQAKMF